MIFYQKISPIILKLSLIVIIFLSLYTAPALAIGPGTGGSKIRINDEVHGPYKLLIATSPLPVMTGQMSVWVRVTGIEDNSLRRDAKVIVEAIPQDGGTIITTEGSHKNAGNDFDYVAHVAVDQSGRWVVKVSVDDYLGQTEVTFTENVSRGRSGTTLIALAIPLVVGLALAGIYMWRKSATQS